jgi:hypothetical protein
VADGFARWFECVVCTLKFGNNSIERARHVGSRIAIGHWVHIEQVDTRGVPLHSVTEGDHCVAQGLGPKDIKNGH